MAISLDRIKQLGGQELSILTAEWIMGWEEDGSLWRDQDGNAVRKMSDWHPAVDFNAIHELEMKLTPKDQEVYIRHVEQMLESPTPITTFQLLTAPAKIRARALLATFLGKSPA